MSEIQTPDIYNDQRPIKGKKETKRQVDEDNANKWLLGMEPPVKQANLILKYDNKEEPSVPIKARNESEKPKHDKGTKLDLD